MEAKEEPKSLDEAAVMHRIREHVQNLLSEGAEPATVSYALAFVATELGLVLAPDPVNVFPVVLSGVAQAGANRQSKDVPASDSAIDAQGPVAGELIH